MGAIVDEFGRKVNWKAATAAQNNDRYRPWEPVDKKDICDLIPAVDRVTLQSHAQRIYIRFGPIKNVVNQRSMLAVGRAWLPVFKGQDKAFGDAAQSWLNETFYQIGDTRGGMHDFRTNLFTWSKEIDVAGEIFILLTETKTGFPQYQGIPSHRISNPFGVANNAQIRGGTLVDGIVYYPSGAPKEYSFCDKNGKFLEWIPAANIIHLFDPEWQYQGRGITALTHCINDCRDIIQSTEWERLAMLQMSSISLIETNENGGPDLDDPSNVLTQVGENCGQGLTVQSMDGGTVRYFKAGTGSKIDTLVNNRPGNPFLEFHEKLLRSAYAGLNWPFAFYSGHGAGGGTAQRTEISMAQRAIEDRQDLLFYAAKRIVGYAIAKAQKRGDLPQSADWWKWEFSYPAKLTIDDGRVMKELESSYKLGFRSASDITGAMGKEYPEVIRQKAEEAAMRQVIAKEVGEKYDVEIDQRELVMFTPNEQQETEENNESSANRKPQRQTETE